MEGAFQLGNIYDSLSLDALIDRTVELRRDPKEREKENAEEALDKWIESNKGETIAVPDREGEMHEIDLSLFSMN